MKSICVAALPDLYVIRWLSRFLKHVFPRSRSNARAYEKVKIIYFLETIAALGLKIA